MGRAAQKTKQIQEQRGEDDEAKNAPHSFIIPRGKVGKNVTNLVSNMRKVMSPFTAEKLKASKRNVMKDFIAMSGPLGVSHLLMFTQSEVSVNLRVCRLPRGPTLTFQVSSYSTISDLSHHIRKHDVNDNHFKHHALLVMNNFSKDVKHLKLTASMFQNMFPSININKVKLRNIKRIALVNYDDETEKIEFRHYHLRVVPLGVSRSVKKLQKRNIPKLSHYNDISQFLLNPQALSESEAELDGEDNSIELPQKMAGTGNTQNEQSAIRLKEIGPRMTLTLTKITDGVCAGEVLYHKFDSLTDKQKAAIVKKKEARQKLKAKRTAEQNEKVRQKKLAKLVHWKKSKQGQEGKEKSNEDSDAEDGYRSAEDNGQEELDDAVYFEQEVGAKPDRDLFPNRRAQKRVYPAGKGRSEEPSTKRKPYDGSTNKRFSDNKVTKIRPGSNTKPSKGGGKRGAHSTSKPFTGGAKAAAGKQRQDKHSKPVTSRRRK